ncbi:hypothetical protein ACOME3_001518 [Neoechinorhynchus agilis]
MLRSSRSTTINTFRLFNRFNRRRFPLYRTLLPKRENWSSDDQSDFRYQEAAALPFLARFLRLRYLIFGSAVGGGLAARNKYNEIADAMPDISWIRDAFPKDVADQMTVLYDGILGTLSSARSRFKEQLTVSKPVVGTEEAKIESCDEKSTDTEDVREQMMEMQCKYQKEIERLEQENKDLKSTILEFSRLRSCSHSVLKKSLIDMYSQVLDDLADFDDTYSVQDQLPRVVVVGDQSSGKTSVLEMITQARIFPRGAGEMMTKSPVRVTLSEGPYHIAKFHNSDREYDLTQETERKALQDEIERRMISSLKGGETISRKAISLSVSGPGLQRMVLVDLPGIISTQTQDMALDTKTTIVQLATEYLKNPNAIILCIQDGSVDAERSNVTDLVSHIDPDGKRTIFVLTKIDCAENNMFSPERIKKILDGKLFPMKALGYFAVVTGRGNASDSIETISTYEKQFFQNSKLIKNGILTPSQVTTRNLSMAVSSCFWNMVRQSVCQQIDIYKATLYSLEAEWRNRYSKLRQKSRDELFDIASTNILDQIIKLSDISVKQWEDILFKGLLDAIKDVFFDEIYIPASQTNNLGAFVTKTDIGLRRLTDSELPRKSIQVAKNCLIDVLNSFVEETQSKQDDVLDPLKRAIHEEVVTRFKWDDKAFDSLKIIQANAVEDKSVPDKDSWQEAVTFMQTVLKGELQRISDSVGTAIGPTSFWNKWIKWQSITDDQNRTRTIVDELHSMFKSGQHIRQNLSIDDVNSIRASIERNHGIEVTNDKIVQLWKTFAYRQLLCTNVLDTCSSCWKFFFYYQKGFVEHGLDCRDVEVFWRLRTLLEITSRALRLQIFTIEARRLERIIKDTLEELSRNEVFKRKFIRGQSVELAEKISKVRSILHHLEDFSKALSKENP